MSFEELKHRMNQHIRYKTPDDKVTRPKEPGSPTMPAHLAHGQVAVGVIHEQDVTKIVEEGGFGISKIALSTGNRPTVISEIHNAKRILGREPRISWTT